MYNYKKEVAAGFGETVTRVKEELKKEGFGVLTEIDVKDTLKKKLDVDYGNYLIIGACNPPFAYKALLADRDIGVMLPCNVIVYENNNRTYAAAIRPTMAMPADNPGLRDIALQVEEKLKRVIDSAAEVHANKIQR